MQASLYQYLYLIAVILLTFSVMLSYDQTKISSSSSRDKNRRRSLLVLTFILIVTIGLRPISGAFVDMMNYHTQYQLILGSPFRFTLVTDNFIFDNVFALFAANNIPEELFFLFVSAVYFGCMSWACVKLFPRDAYLAFVVYLGAFSTFSYATNGIKAGAAASIFLLAIAYREKKFLAIFFLWLSLGFHHSMLAPIVAYVIAYFYKKPNAYLSAWIACLTLAAAHVTFFQEFFSGFTDEHGAEYLTVDLLDKDVTGFRPDFILYSAVPIFIGYYLIRKRYVVSEFYNFLWCTYTMTNCVFLLCTYGSYINRIAYLSWLMYPIVLLYPFVNTEWDNHPIVSKQYLKYAVYGHLGFTAFMTFIYYA